MPVQRPQEIYAGAAVIYIGSSFTPATTDITTNVNNVAGYTAQAVEIVVDDASVVAPNVWDGITGTKADPPVVDVLLNVRTREIFYCDERTDATETLKVVRAGSLWWDKQKPSDSTYAKAMVDNDEIQYLGTGTMPDLSDGIIFTDDAVTITSAYDMFDTRDNLLGNSDRYIGSPGTTTIECTIPRNTISTYKDIIGRQKLSDGQISGTSYMSVIGGLPAGTKITGKFLVVVPLEQWTSDETKTVGANTYKSHSRAFFFPYAMLDPSETFTYNEGEQLNVPATYTTKKDLVFCQHGFHGWLDNAHRLLKSE